MIHCKMLLVMHRTFDSDSQILTVFPLAFCKLPVAIPNQRHRKYERVPKTNRQSRQQVARNNMYLYIYNIRIFCLHLQSTNATCPKALESTTIPTIQFLFDIVFFYVFLKKNICHIVIPLKRSVLAKHYTKLQPFTKTFPEAPMAAVAH